MRRYPTSSTSEIYDFMMFLFDHGKPEEFLLFVRNLNITLESTGTQETNAQVQYLCTLVRGEEFSQFDFLSDDMGNMDTSLTVYFVLKGLARYFLL